MKEIYAKINKISTDILDCMNNREIIAFINSIFSENFAKDEWVAKTSYDYSDECYYAYFLKISETPFMILFDYQVPSAYNYRRLNPKYFVHMDFESDTIKYILPETVLISAKENANLTIQASAMNNAEHFEYSAVPVNVHNFELDEMIEKCLFPFIPFYPLRFEKILLNPHTAEDEIKIFDEMMECTEKIKDAAKRKKISSKCYKEFSSCFFEIFSDVIKYAYASRMIIFEMRYIYLLLKITELKTDLKKERITQSVNDIIEFYNFQYQLLADEGNPKDLLDSLAFVYTKNFFKQLC